MNLFFYISSRKRTFSLEIGQVLSLLQTFPGIWSSLAVIFKNVFVLRSHFKCLKFDLRKHIYNDIDALSNLQKLWQHEQVKNS